MMAMGNTAHFPTPDRGEFAIRDARFASGELLPELTVHYLTIGAPVRDRSGAVRNAVLLLHGTGGSCENFLRDEFAGVLFGPGQLLDATRYYIIIPDGIGHGQSSKPSDGLRARFPRYTFADMVAAQHRLLTEKLAIDHLRLVLGVSMGGMQTWLWGETHPDFMDALMPLASLPVQIAGRNRMIRRMIMDAIRHDPGWQEGDYTSQPYGLVLAVYALMFMGSSPLHWQMLAPTREAADRLFDQWVQARLAQADANDLLYQYDASRDYDPSPHLERIRAPLLAVNSADDQVNPPELGIMEREIGRVPRGRFVLLPVSDRTVGHGTHSLPEVWQQYLAELLEESKPRGGCEEDAHLPGGAAKS